MKRIKAKLHKEKGVFAMSIVENPAMQSSFVALSEDKPITFAEVDSERKILLGAALIPDKPIYRNDEQGEYEMVFEKDCIEFAAHNFVKKGFVNNSNENHSITLGGGKAGVVESWIKEDEKHDKSLKFGIDEPVGTWFIMMKVDDDEIYQKAKNGELNGFSIEGLFDMSELNLKTEIMSKKEESLLNRLENLLFKKEKEQKLAQAKLVDGETVVEYDGETPEAGAAIQVLTEEGAIPAPVGEHELEDGTILVVTEEGLINEVKQKEQEMGDDKLEALLDELFGKFSKHVEGKFSELSKKFEAMEKEQKEQSEKIEKFAAAPADKKANTTQQVKKQDLSQMSVQERLAYKFNSLL